MDDCNPMRFQSPDGASNSHILATSTELRLADVIIRNNEVDENALLISELLRQRSLVPDVWMNPEGEPVSPRSLPRFIIDPRDDYLIICPMSVQGMPQIGRYGLHLLVKAPPGRITFVSVDACAKYVPLPKRLHVSTARIEGVKDVKED